MIELDGSGHSEEYDAIRDYYLKSRRFRVIRIQNSEVKQDRDQILRKLLNLLES